MADRRMGFAALSLVFPVGPVIVGILNWALDLLNHVVRFPAMLQLDVVLGTYFVLPAVFMLVVAPRMFNARWNFESSPILGVWLFLWTATGIAFWTWPLWPTVGSAIGWVMKSPLPVYSILLFALVATIWFASLFLTKRGN